MEPFDSTTTRSYYVVSSEPGESNCLLTRWKDIYFRARLLYWFQQVRCFCVIERWYRLGTGRPLSEAIKVAIDGQAYGSGSTKCRAAFVSIDSCESVVSVEIYQTTASDRSLAIFFPLFPLPTMGVEQSDWRGEEVNHRAVSIAFRRMHLEKPSSARFVPIARLNWLRVCFNDPSTTFMESSRFANNAVLRWECVPNWAVKPKNDVLLFDRCRDCSRYIV